ncbi:MAG: NUDIX domain-containing protein [Bryobacter sp.]|jgi:8-oxo-dGTP pyrophosphatase MutT (NUDIX family)|nr:NUDIX domain-containing protein [Bryobacter sp. CoA8 C33]
MRIVFPSNLMGDEKSIELIEMMVAETREPFSRRQFNPGHVTATGLVLHPEGRAIAMVLHGRLKRWLLPGGHVEEEDGTVIAAAAREVAEETGLVVEGGEVIGADVHGIPAKLKDGREVEPYHLHHDVLVWFRARGKELRASEESEDVRWVWPEEFDLHAVPANVRRAYGRIR